MPIPLYRQLALQPQWACHCVELDIVQSESDWNFGISHLGNYDSAVTALSNALKEIKGMYDTCLPGQPCSYILFLTYHQ